MTNQLTKNVNCFIMFSALSEIMLELHDNSKMLNVYDSNLNNKLKNLKANFERTSKKVFGSFTESEQKVFFNMINIFEHLIENAGDQEKFISLLAIMDEFQKGELKVIEG